MLCLLFSPHVKSAENQHYSIHPFNSLKRSDFLLVDIRPYIRIQFGYFNCWIGCSTWMVGCVPLFHGLLLLYIFSFGRQGNSCLMKSRLEGKIIHVWSKASTNVGRGLMGDMQQRVVCARVVVYKLMYSIEDSVEKERLTLGRDLVLHANIVKWYEMKVS